MEGFIAFLLICAVIALVVVLAVFLVDIYPFFYITLNGWVFLVVFLVLSVLLLVVKIILKKKILRVNLEENEEYKAALETDARLKEEYERQVAEVLAKKQEELRMETEKSDQHIRKLTEQIKKYQEEIDANPVIHQSDKEPATVNRLISLMERGRADSVKDALNMYDAQRSAEIQEEVDREIRRWEKEEERQREERRRRAEEERRDRMEAEQKRYHDRMIEEQEKQNEELRKLNEYK